MSDFIDGLGLSKRAANGLREHHKIHSAADFLALDRATILRTPSFGLRSFQEIAAKQEWLRSLPKSEQEHNLVLAGAWRARFVQELDSLLQELAENFRIVTVIEETSGSFLVIAQRKDAT